MIRIPLKRLLVIMVLFLATNASGAESAVQPFGISLNDTGQGTEVASAVKVLLGLTMLSLLPAILVSMTAFIRISVVLSMLRHALGTQETPSNTILISLALFLTLFTMMPVLERANTEAFKPYLKGTLSTKNVLQRGVLPFREFMLRQTREKDLALMVELSRTNAPEKIEDIPTPVVIPAFMLSELRSAFQIGFVLFLPFLLIDLVVSTLLMAMGMMMVPPATISLPVKILMFVLIDGWSLIVKALLGTFA